MSTCSGEPDDQDESGQGKTAGSGCSETDGVPATKSPVGRVFSAFVQSATTPTLCTALAVLLLASEAVTSGSVGRFAQASSVDALATSDHLAGLLSHESAASVALRQDGTLSIDTGVIETREDESTPSWVALTQPDPIAEAGDGDMPGLSGRSEASPDPIVEPLRRVGMTLSRTGHVSIVPPFVVLSRGSESIMLSLESGSRVVPEASLPSWASQRHPDGRVVADFGWSGTVEVLADSVNVRRRSLDWHLPDAAI